MCVCMSVLPTCFKKRETIMAKLDVLVNITKRTNKKINERTWPGELDNDLQRQRKPISFQTCAMFVSLFQCLTSTVAAALIIYI